MAQPSQGPSPQTLGTPTPRNHPSIEIDPRLREKFSEVEIVQYLIEFEETADLSPAYEMEWEPRGRLVVEALQEAALRSQTRVRRYLEH